MRKKAHLILETGLPKTPNRFDSCVFLNLPSTITLYTVIVKPLQRESEMEIVLSKGDIEIGFVENTTSKHCAVLWIYKRKKGRWIKISNERIALKYRSGYLKRLIQKNCKLVALGRGT